MNDLYKIKKNFVHLVQISELRMARGDDLPMSPLKGRDCVGLHFTWYRKHDDIVKVLPLLD